MERYGLRRGWSPKTRARTRDPSRRQSRTIGWAMATVGIPAVLYGMGFFASTGSMGDVPYLTGTCSQGL